MDTRACIHVLAPICFFRGSSPTTEERRQALQGDCAHSRQIILSTGISALDRLRPQTGIVLLVAASESFERLVPLRPSFALNLASERGIMVISPEALFVVTSKPMKTKAVAKRSCVNAVP